MKRDKIIYWIATGLISAGMLMSGIMYFTNPEVLKGFQTLGFPPFFVQILGLAKLLGAIALVAPVGHRIKEWAYAGFLFVFIGAIWTHVVTSTPFMGPVIALALLTTSYIFWNRLILEKKTV